MDSDKSRLESSSDDDFFLKLSETVPDRDSNYLGNNKNKKTSLVNSEKSDALELSEWHNYTLESDDEFSCDLTDKPTTKRDFVSPSVNTESEDDDDDDYGLGGDDDGDLDGDLDDDLDEDNDGDDLDEDNDSDEDKDTEMGEDSDSNEGKKMWDTMSETSVEYECQNPNNEVLEENNNDPNNNMDMDLSMETTGQMEPAGQRQGKEEKEERVTKNNDENTWKENRKENGANSLNEQKINFVKFPPSLSVSPQPQAGCSKHFDSIERVFKQNSNNIHDDSRQDDKIKSYPPEIRQQAHDILDLVKKLTYESICEGLLGFNWSLRDLLTEDLKKLLPKKKRHHESSENFEKKVRKLDDKFAQENDASPEVVVLPRILKTKKIGETITITSSDEESTNKKMSHKADKNAVDLSRKSPELRRKHPFNFLPDDEPPTKIRQKIKNDHSPTTSQDMPNIFESENKDVPRRIIPPLTPVDDLTVHPLKLRLFGKEKAEVATKTPLTERLAEIDQNFADLNAVRYKGAIPKRRYLDPPDARNEQPTHSSKSRGDFAVFPSKSRDTAVSSAPVSRNNLHQQTVNQNLLSIGRPEVETKQSHKVRINFSNQRPPPPVQSIRHQLHQPPPPQDIHPEEITQDDVANLLEFLDEATNVPVVPQKKKFCQEIYVKLRAMFPNIKSTYIQRFCPEDWYPNGSHENQLAQIIDNLLTHEAQWEYEEPQAEIKNEIGGDGDDGGLSSVDDVYQQLIEIFPNAEPGYMRRIAEMYYQKNNELKEYIDRNIQNPTYTTREQFMAKLKVTEEQKKYTINFDLNHFLEIFPNPKQHFEDPKRVLNFDPIAMECLKVVFKKIKVQTISRTYKACGYNMSIAARQLTLIGSDMKTSRSSPEYPSESIPLLQEMAYVKHFKEIENHIEGKKQREIDEFNRLKARNELLECQCCYDTEVMPSKCSTCDQGHVFCNSCVLTGSGTKIGDGETHIPCFLGCGSEFSLSTLQKILQPTKFSILLKKRQAAEVMAADLDGLVSCPFCHFATIPAEGDKVFKCLNPECMKESCIECKEPNHVPYRCDEVGKADKTRKYIEEKMTEALSRVCNKCKKTFIKEEGCNKITCTCGAKMCYLCDKEIQDYNHFRGQGSNDLNKCPLYSDNTLLNYQTVKKVAEEVKKQLLAKDPTLNIDIESMLPPKPTPRAGPHETIAGDPNLATIHAARVLGKHK